MHSIFSVGSQMPASRRTGPRPGRSTSDEASAWKREFGLLLRAARVAADLSQEQLAERVGVHRTYAGTVERGEQNISLTNICAFARAVGVQPAALMPVIPTSGDPASK